MRIAIDIDSTLHHYWDVLSAAAQRRFGIDLPYEEQFDWGITRLKPEQLTLLHRRDPLRSGDPRRPALSGRRRGRQRLGRRRPLHPRHLASLRALPHDATATWLDNIGLRFDELYCSQDKVTRCAEIGIDLLIDDSPHNIETALERGIAVATIRHPWNADVCETEDVVCAHDWAELARKLRPLLARESVARG